MEMEGNMAHSNSLMDKKSGKSGIARKRGISRQGTAREQFEALPVVDKNAQERMKAAARNPAHTRKDYPIILA